MSAEQNNRVSVPVEDVITTLNKHKNVGINNDAPLDDATIKRVLQNRDKCKSVVIGNSYTLINVPPGKYYVFKREKANPKKGGFASVYKGYELDPETLRLGKPVAIKHFDSQVVENTQESIEREVEYLGKRFDVEMPVSGLGETYVVMEYVPTEDLGHLFKTVNDKDVTLKTTDTLNDLAFDQRATLMWFLMLDLNTLHHNKNKKTNKKNKEDNIYPALIHKDLKLENIRLDVKNRKIADARIVDYGLAQAIDDNPEKLEGISRRGSDYYISPELIEGNNLGQAGNAGLKSDIRSMVPVLLSILGVKDIFLEAKVRIEEKANARAIAEKYVLKETANRHRSPVASFEQPPEILRDFNVDAISTGDNILDGILKGFINRMASWRYADRPHSDECLRFFTALHNYVIQPNDDALETLECLGDLSSKLLDKDKKIPVHPKNQFALFKFVSQDKNYAGKEKHWLLLARQLVDNIHGFSVKEQLAFFTEFNKHQNHKNENKQLYKAIGNRLVRVLLEQKTVSSKPVPVLDSLNINDKLALFIILSRNKNYNANKNKWLELAKEFVLPENLNRVGGKQRLQVLRCLNKHKSDSKKAKKYANQLANHLRVQNPDDKFRWYGATKRAARKLNWAIRGNITFFAQRRLKAAINAEENSALGKSVKELTVV